MIDFSKVTAVTIPEGVVTQIAKDGVVLWKLETSKPIILEVEKKILTTYYGGTTRNNEQCVLLDIYPKKSNATIAVSYGGLTKTLSFSGTNAQKVFFGTFGGETDSVETPISGTLTISGDCAGFASGSYIASSKGASSYAKFIKSIIDWGEITIIPSNAFNNYSSLELSSLPDGIVRIEDRAFYGCTSLALTELPSSITSIGASAFCGCFGLQFNDNFLKNGLISVGDYAFDLDQGDESLIGTMQLTIPETVTSIGGDSFGGPIKDAHSYSYFNRVTMLPKTPPSYTSTIYPIFGEVYSNFSLVVPKGCSEVYKTAAGWSEYANYITEAS